MPVTATNVLANGDQSNQTSYVTASVSLVAGRMYLLSVRAECVTGPANTPTVTGASQTWEQVATRVDASNNERTLTLFRCIATSTTSGALTIDYAGQTQTHTGWVVDEFTGMAPGGNGASAIVQSTGGDSNGSSVTSFADLTLSAFGSAQNATYASIFTSSATGSVTNEGGYTEVVESGVTGTGKCETQFKATSDTSPSWTLASAVVIAAIAVEIRLFTRSYAVMVG